MSGRVPSAIKSIRSFCVACTGGDMEAVRTCKPIPDSSACALWPYRMGRNPNITAESKAKARERWLAKNKGKETATSVQE